MKEYRKIPSLKFLYEITNYGKLRNVKSKRIKKPFINKKQGKNSSYKIYSIDNKWIDQTKLQEHRLVAEVWCKDWYDDCIINHEDNNGLNNYYKNLVCSTYSYNNQHAWDNGLKKSMYVYTIHNGIELEFYTCYKASQWVKDTMKYKGAIKSMANNISKHIRGKNKGITYKHKWYRK